MLCVHSAFCWILAQPRVSLHQRFALERVSAGGVAEGRGQLDVVEFFCLKHLFGEIRQKFWADRPSALHASEGPTFSARPRFPSLAQQKALVYFA